MTQILRMDNPLFGRGLKWQQRLCYLNAMLHFQYGLPWVVFLTAPLVYLLFNQNIIASSASTIFAYVLPHLFMAIWLNSRMNGRYRYTFWGEIYETVMAFHLIIPTFLTLLSPKHGKFNVTDKGGLLDEGFFDAHIVRPHIIVACFLVLAIIAGIVRAVMYDYFNVDPRVIVFNVVWAMLSVIILLAAIAVAKETRDLSMGGVKLVTPDDRYRQRIPSKRWNCCCNPAASVFRSMSSTPART